MKGERIVYYMFIYLSRQHNEPTTMTGAHALKLAMLWMGSGMFICQAADYRLSVMKAGYGVNFDRVGHIVVDGTFLPYTHTWAIPWPKVQPLHLPLFECSLAINWTKTCLAINRFIQETNNFAFETLDSIALSLENGKRIIPPTMNRSIFQRNVAHSPGHISPASQTTFRRDRRAIPGKDFHNEMPEFMREQPSEDVSDYIPTYLVGRVWSDLTGAPGVTALKNLKNHLRTVGSLEYSNIQDIKKLDADVYSFGVTEQAKVDHLFSSMNVSNSKLDSTVQRIRYDKRLWGTREQALRQKINFLWYIDEEVMTKVLPNVCEMYAKLSQLRRYVKQWLRSVATLTRGYISPFMISQNDMQKVLRDIAQTMLKKPMYAHLKLPSLAVNYYYRLKNIAYTHLFNNDQQPDSGSTLFITLTIPLLPLEGILPVYRINVFAVPTTAGLSQSTRGDKRPGYTELSNMPDLIAISENQETYLEMSTSLFHSCRGSSDIKICEGGMPALRKRRARRTSCAFALYLENWDDVEQECDIRYSDIDEYKPYGSAMQSTADGTFLVHASQREKKGDKWRLSCPTSARKYNPLVDVCNMCRITIPCECSLSGADFLLAQRYTGCSLKDEDEEKHVTYMHHVNTPMVKSLYPESQEANYASFMAFNKRLTPPFILPTITFKKADDFYPTMEAMKKFGADLNQTLERERRNRKSYNSEVTASLAVARDFSDVVVNRAGSVQKALGDVLSVFFGGGVAGAMSLIFTPIFIALIAFVISILDCISQRRNRKSVMKSNRNKEIERVPLIIEKRVTHGPHGNKKHKRRSTETSFYA